MKIFTRSKHITCDKTADNTLETRSGLVDTIHEIELTIITDIEKREIVKASADFLRAPYLICAEAGKRAANLAGLSIDQPGISAGIKERVGGSQGCSHLIDLTLDAVKAIKQSLYAFTPGSREERIVHFDNMLRNTCYAHSHPIEEKVKTSVTPNVIVDRRK